jgi:hypothetical protein
MQKNIAYSRIWDILKIKYIEWKAKILIKNWVNLLKTKDYNIWDKINKKNNS